MSEPDSPGSARDASIRAWMEQCLGNPTIKTPREIFREQCIAMQGMADREIELLMGSDPTSDHTAARDKILQYGGQLKELKDKHEATVQDKKHAHEKQMKERHKQLLMEFINHLGLSLAGPWLRELLEATAAGEDTPVIHRSYPPPDDSTAPSDAGEEPIPDAPENSHPMAEQNDQLENADEANHSNHDEHHSDHLQTDTQPHPDLERHPGIQPTLDHEPHAEAQPSPTLLRKRPTSPPARAEEADKRPRLDDAPRPHAPDTERSIDFEQVFQDGQAEMKYMIARYPPKDGQWYILECKVHGQHFTTNRPIHGAAKHLYTPAHGYLPKNHDLAVQILGTRVRNCNQKMADMNNLVAKEAFELGLGIPPTMRRLKRPRPGGSTNEPRSAAGSHPQKHNGPHTRSSQNVPSIINPQPGEIYAGYWRAEKRFYPVLILPQGRFTRLGLKVSLLDTGLLKAKPSCYVADENDKNRVRWAPGYEDGGPLVSKRKFPVVYFDKPTFPKKYTAGWVSARDLKEFDPDDKSIPYRDLVAKFMQSQPDENLADKTNDIESIDGVIGAPPTNLEGVNGSSEYQGPLQDPQPAVYQGPSIQEEPVLYNESTVHDVPALKQEERHSPQNCIYISSGDESDESDDESDFEEKYSCQGNFNEGITNNVPPAIQKEPSERNAGDQGEQRNNEAGESSSGKTQPQEHAGHDGQEPEGNLNTTDDAEDGILFDYKTLWRRTSSDVEREMEELQSDIAGPLNQYGGQVNTTTSKPKAPTTTGTKDDAPGNLGPSTSSQQPGGNLVPGPAAEDDTEIMPALINAEPPRPATEQSLSKSQPPPSSAILTAEQRYLQIVASRAAVPTALGALRDERSLSRATSQPGCASGHVATFSSAQQIGSWPQQEKHLCLGDIARTDSMPHPRSRGSGFFDAVLSPRVESPQLNSSPQLPTHQVLQDNLNTQPRVKNSPEMYSRSATQTQGPPPAMSRQ